MNKDELKLNEILTDYFNDPKHQNFGHRLTYGEPEEEDMSEEEYNKSNSMEEKLLQSLNLAKKHIFLGVDRAIQYLNAQTQEFGEFNKSCIEQTYWRWFEDGDLDTIFENGADGKDGNFYIEFILTIVRIIQRKPQLLDKDKSNFVNGSFTNDKVKLEKYILSHFDLDNDNPIHKKFAYLVKKICDYFDNYDKEQKEISNQLDKELQVLKQELLDEDPDTTKNNFLSASIDDLIAYNIYHVRGVDNARELLELVKIVIDNNDTLQSIPDLTTTNDWKPIIYNWYDIESDTEPLWEDEEPSEYEHGITDITPENLEDWNQEAITREKLAGASRGGSIGGKIGGKASKRNHTKGVTIRNIQTGEEFVFEDTTQCYTFLGVTKMTFNNFKQGKKTRLNKQWQLIK